MLNLTIAACLMLLTQQPTPTAAVFPVISTVTRQPALDDIRREWYSKHLVAMKELALPAGSGETYRFLWLRTSNNPVAVRVACTGSACVLTGKRTDGEGGYKPGSVVERKTRTLSDDEVGRFREMLARIRFWGPQPADGRIGLDGSQWILEGSRGQSYHLWDVWTPEPSGPYASYRELCLLLVRLSGLAVSQNEIY